MTMRQTFGNWTQVTGWSTAITAVANGNTTTSGQIDNSSQRSYAVDVAFTWVKASAAGTGLVELWILPEGSDGALQDASAPPRGGRLVGTVSTAAETTERMQTFRMNEMPERFKFYLNNLSGANTNTGSDLRYRWVDFVDV